MSDVTSIQEQLLIENKIKQGAETMLQVIQTSQRGETIPRQHVEQTLAATNKKISALTKQLLYFNAEPLKRSNSDKLRPQPQVATSGRDSLNVSSPKLRKDQMDISTKNVANTFTELTSKIRNPNEIPHTRLDCMNTLLKLIKSLGNVELHFSVQSIIKSVRTCLVDNQKEMRANAFRFLRHLVTNERIILTMFKDCNVEIFVVKALTRDQRYDVEREQALRLIRTCIDVPGGGELIPQSVVRILVALSEQPDEKLKTVCLETLCELAIKSTQTVAFCGGFKVLVAALIDGPRELCEPIVYALLFVLDNEDTRSFVRPSLELEMIISCFTDAYGRTNGHEDRLYACSRALVAMLKSWTGIIYLCMDNKRALRSIVDALKLNHEETRKILLEMFYEIFLIEMPKWYPDFVSSRYRTVNNNPPEDPAGASFYQLINLYAGNRRVNLINQHQTILLAIFIDVGLVEALMEVIQDGSKYIVTRATILVGELRELSNELLPPSFNTKINSLPTLFQVAANFENESRRHAATLALTRIDSLQNSKEGFLLQSLDDTVARRWLARTLALKHGNAPPRHLKKHMDDVKIRLGVQIDDLHFKNLLHETEVHSAKEYSKWNWDGIIELIQGPLQNPRRLDEVIRNSKMLKKLLLFYRPLHRQFSEIKRGMGTQKYVKIGCDLFKTLLINIDGMRFLVESKLLQEIAECLAQLDPFVEQPEAIFSKDKMVRTLTAEYFTLLGSLTKTAEGQKILERCRVFTTFYHVGDLKTRDDVIKSMITNMDYSLDSHPRAILSKVLTSGNTQMRLFATNHLRFILRTNSEDFHEWAIPLLVTQLYDPVTEVCERAVEVLDEAFDNEINLQAAVNLRPTLIHLGTIGNPLLLRFLSTSVGLQYMQECDYKNDIDEWFQFGIINYVSRIELNLNRTLHSKSKGSKLESNNSTSMGDIGKESAESLLDFSATVPPHFFGELTKTSEGCQLLADKGYFTYFVDLIRLWGLKSLSGVPLKKLKAVLWAVGHIGSNINGLAFLKKDNVVERIVSLAQGSPVWSIRGTCCYVLGLISKTHAGAEILDSLGWEAITRSDQYLDGLCIPKKMDNLLHIPNWKYTGSWPEKRIKLQYKQSRFDSTEEEIIREVGSMSSHISSSTSSKTLSRLRTETPSYFARVELFLEVQRLLSVFHYRLAARRFLNEIFDRVIFSEKGLAKIDELNGLNYQVKPVRQIHKSVDSLGHVDGEEENYYSSQKRSAGAKTEGTSTSSISKENEKILDGSQVMRPKKAVKGF